MGSLPEADLEEMAAEDGSLRYKLEIPIAEDGAYQFELSAEESVLLEVSETYPDGSISDTVETVVDSDGSVAGTAETVMVSDGSAADTAEAVADSDGSAANPAETGFDASGTVPKRVEVSYTSPWTLVRDTVKPVLSSLTIVPEEGVAHPDINEEHGNRYYFNKGFAIRAVVEDRNLAAGRKESGIAFLRAADTSEENSEEVRFEEINAFSDKNESAYTFDGTTAVFTDTVTADGVYAYAIFGTDLAGNPVEFGENVDRETIMLLASAGEESGSGAGESGSGAEVSGSGSEDAGSKMRQIRTCAMKPLISRHIVVDTKAPTGTLTITAGGKNAYIRDTDRQAPTYSMPYQLADSAVITLAAAESERTPVKVTLTVAEKNGTEETSAESQGFIFHGSAVRNIDGKMIFLCEGRFYRGPRRKCERYGLLAADLPG